jgi:Spy/CpxP family protein refolding chaperone
MTVLVLAVTTTGWAAGLDLPHGKWWENERVVKRIGLTEEQQRAISDLVYRHVLRMVDLNAGVKKAEIELAELVDQADFDAAAVRRAFGNFQKARLELENERFEMLLAVRANLTADQWSDLLEIRRQLERLRDSRRPGDGPPVRRPPEGPRGGGRQPADGGWQ